MMMADDDLEQRLNAISVAEMRRRVDLAVAYVREIRRALAVEAGMTAEGAKGPIPKLDAEESKRVFQEIIEMLPLLREPLTAEQRARMRPISAAQHEEMKEVLDELAADEEGFDALMEESGAEVRHTQILEMREGMEKMEMLGEVARESAALLAEMEAYKARLLASIDATLSRARGRGPAN